eukprot:g79377.t1
MSQSVRTVYSQSGLKGTMLLSFREPSFPFLPRWMSHLGQVRPTSVVEGNGPRGCIYADILVHVSSCVCLLLLSQSPNVSRSYPRAVCKVRCQTGKKRTPTCANKFSRSRMVEGKRGVTVVFFCDTQAKKQE